EPVAAESPGRWRRGWLIGLAAAASILMVLRLTVPGSRHPTTIVRDTSTPSVLHELDELNSSELQVLLETLAPAAAATTHSEHQLLEELDSKSLERLLRSLEG